MGQVIQFPIEQVEEQFEHVQFTVRTLCRSCRASSWRGIFALKRHDGPYTADDLRLSGLLEAAFVGRGLGLGCRSCKSENLIFCEITPDAYPAGAEA